MKEKKVLSALIIAFLCLLCTCSTVFGAEEEPSLVEALVVTEVLEWGESVTAIRLEYSEEISSTAIEYSNEHPGKVTYTLINDRDIDYIYVNNSGEKDDIQLKGKYVFINLTIPTTDQTKYRDYIVFNTKARTRDTVMPIYLFQQEEIETISGAIIPPSGRIETSGEIRIIIDDFETITYTNEETGSWLNYHLYIPEGYENKDETLENLPLVVHFPSGDYRYKDDGRYMGALFTHPDALYWATKESQEAHPAFIVTMGAPEDKNWSTPFNHESELLNNYIAAIAEIEENYNIDSSRIYAISLAGGTNAMYWAILNNPELFAAQITTAYDPYHVFKDTDLAEEKYGEILELMPSWLFAGLTDGSGAGCLGEEDTRLKGERLRDIGNIMNEKGYNIDIAYGKDGELMWNGLLRGEEAEMVATAQIERAKEKGSESLITLYMPNTIRQTMHWSWNATYSNAVVRDWLFQQVKE